MEPNAPLNNATQYLAGANIGKGTMNNESSGKTLPVMKFNKDKDTPISAFLSFKYCLTHMNAKL
jgi:hypothetical protein